MRSAFCTLKCMQRRVHGDCAGRNLFGSHSKSRRRRADTAASDLRQTNQSYRCYHRNARLHFVLASVRDRSLRSRIDRLLHRRDRRAGVRPLGAVLHPRGDAVLLRGARGVRRIVFDVHPGRRVSRRQGSDGLDARKNFGVGADVRLHLDRAGLFCRQISPPLSSQ